MLGGPVNEYERQVYEYLRDNLPDEDYLFTNFSISRDKDKNCEIDGFLFSATKGLYVIEVKPGDQPIRGNWIGFERNPIDQADEDSKIIRSKLKKWNDSLEDISVKFLVGLTGEKSPNLNNLNEDNLRKRHIVWYQSLPDYLSKEPDDPLYRPLFEMIRQAVVSKFSHQGEWIGDYQLQGEAWKNPLYTAYYARGRVYPYKYLLKIFDVPPMDDRRRKNDFLVDLNREMDAVSCIEEAGDRESGGSQNVIIGKNAFLARRDSQYVVAMQWVSGRSLAELIGPKSPLTFEQKCRIASQICRGMAFAHSAGKGVIHRNLHPGNIILDASGNAKIINFDFARFLDTSVHPKTLSMDTRAYAAWEQESTQRRQYVAPEMLKGSNVPPAGESPRYFRATKETDIYSIGAILWELFTGKPVPDLADRALMPKQLADLGIPASLADQMTEMCAKEPDKRPKDLVAIANSLEHVGAEQPKTVEIPDLQLGQVFNNKYLIEKLIASTEMSVTYLARDSMLDGKVTLKFLKTTDVQAAIEETKRVFKLSKQVQFSGRCASWVAGDFIGDPNGPERIYYQIMEYIEGNSLKDVILKPNPPEASELLRICLEVIRSVKVIHEAGWTHRDIKPANFILTPIGEVKIIDFGLSRRIEEPSHFAAATFGYTPPEVLSKPGQPAGEWTQRGDVYSTARVIAALLCGEKMDRLNGPDFDEKIIADKAPAWEGLLISDTDEKDPSKRCSSAIEMLPRYEKALAEANEMINPANQTVKSPAIEVGQNQPLEGMEQPMDYDAIVIKLLEKAEKQEKDFGNTAAAVEFNKVAEVLQAWIDKGQNGNCPVDLEKYGFNPAPVVDRVVPMPTQPAEKEIQSIPEEENIHQPPEPEKPEMLSEKPDTELAEQPAGRQEKPDISALASELETPDKLNLREQLDQANQYYKNGQLRAAVSLSKLIESQATGSSLKESARNLLDLASRQLKTALKKALADGDAARSSEQLDEARKYYQIAQELDPDNESAKAALLDLRGALKDQLSETRLTALRSGLKERRDIHRLGDTVYEAEALDGEGKLTPELVELLEEARKFYDQTRKAQGEETTQMRFGDLSARSDAVAKIRARVSNRETTIFDSTTNTERPGFELLQEANRLLEQASADAAQYELDLVDKQKTIHPRYAAQRLESATKQPFSEKYIRQLNEKKAEVEELVRVQERSENLLDQVQREEDPVKIYGLVLQAQKTFAYIPGLPEQVAQARQMALNALVVEVGKCQRDARVALDAALSSGDYKPARDIIARAETIAATWPEERQPDELKRLIEEANGIGRKIDKSQNDWNEYSKYAKSIREQVVDSSHRAAVLDLFRNIRTEERFKAFPDIRILASEIDNYTDVGEKLNEAQAAYSVGEWSRVFELADKVIKSGKAGQLVEKFNTLFETATVELSIGRAKTLLDQDDVFEANNVLSAILNREKGTARESELRQRLEDELAKILQCIKDNPPMQAQYDQAKELIGFRDSALLKAFVNPLYALRQAQGKDSEGKVTNPEMRSLVSDFKKDSDGPDPSAEELSRKAEASLLVELSRRYGESAYERLSALRLFRFVGGDLTKVSEQEKSTWRLSLRAAEARRAGRLLVNSIRRDVLPALMKAYANRKEEMDSSSVLKRLAENARGLREAELLETDDEKDAGRWLEVKWGRQQADAQEEHGDWDASVRIWAELKDLFNMDETRKAWRQVRIQQAVELAHNQIVNDHKGEDALLTLEAVKAEPGIGNSWEVEQALADAYTLLGNYDSAFGSLEEAFRFAPEEGKIVTLLQNKQKEIAREKEIQDTIAQAQAKKLSNPYDALQVLQDALAKPALKNSRRLRELKEKIYTDTSETLMKSAKEQQVTGSDEDKLKAILALVDLQRLEELADIPTSKRQSNKEMEHLRSDLASVAESVIHTAQEFDPAAKSLDQAISQATALSSRLQAFDNVLPMFSSELDVIKDKLTKRRREIAKSLDNLKELQKALGKALDPALWNQAMQIGDFQPIENYSRQIGRLELGGMQEVQDFDRRLAEWKEIRTYLLREIDEIEKKFSPEEAFDEVNIRITRAKSLPKFRQDGRPWEKIYQPDYDAIHELMNATLRVNDLYSAGELVGWQAVAKAAVDRQEELEHWLDWDKQCHFAMDDLVQAGAITGTHTPETPYSFRKRDWENQAAAAQSTLQLLSTGLKAEGKVVDVHSGKAEAILNSNKARQTGAEDALREAKRQLELIEAKGIHFPTPAEFNDAVAQKDWYRLESLLERARAAGTTDPKELKQVDVYSKVLANAKKEIGKRKSIFDRLSGRG